ncbi:MAG: hypothetical protein GF416_01770 [Candidatus Altiarchaeales archaeon]|nr:hypothetical protein [Candidatus Altiarchaeales archaeon]MBD3415844.1 hypothetical protein [Candidatus Altiarchaeales archaeon]
MGDAETIGDFQEVIRKFIEKMGFEVESSEMLVDGSVDFKAKTNNPMGGRVLSIIRASAFTRMIGESDVESLEEAMRRAGAVRAAYITTSGFSESAVESAKGKPISLINKYQLMDSIEKRGLATDKDLMESLDRYGLAEKHFQGIEQSFTPSKKDEDVREFFESKRRKDEKLVKVRLRYAPVSVLRVVTMKDVWTSDQTLRSVEKKDYLFVNLNNLELYYLMQKRRKNKTEYTFMKSDIIRKIHDLPEYSKQHLLDLLDHGDLPIEDLEGKELSILKNKKVIEIYEGKRTGPSEFVDYLEMALNSILETINIIINEVLIGLASMGEGSESPGVKEEKPQKKVSAQINMPHFHGGIYDIWKHLRTEDGVRMDAEMDPLIYSSKTVALMLKSIFNATVKPQGLIFMPYHRAKYVEPKSKKVTKYEILMAPRFKEPSKEEPGEPKKREVRVTPKIKARRKPIAGEFKLIK